jgi:hypothetical protein
MSGPEQEWLKAVELVTQVFKGRGSEGSSVGALQPGSPTEAQWKQLLEHKARAELPCASAMQLLLLLLLLCHDFACKLCTMHICVRPATATRYQKHTC